MKRRNVLTGLGALAGASGIAGTGAFTSVSANRSVNVAVTGDDSALLRLRPCPKGKNGAYVEETTNGTVAINISDSNSNNPPAGSGVNSDAVTVINNVLEIGNQGTQPVGVWLDVDPKENDGTDRVQFYLDSDQSTEIVGQDNAKCLPVGESICVGLLIDTRGVSPDDTLFKTDSPELVINADANVGCTAPPTEGGTRSLSTGVADWQVTGLPDEESPPGSKSIPYDAFKITPPDVWATSDDAEWVDPFGDGGLENDPVGNYEYKLRFATNKPRTLVIDEYGSDNPVEFFLNNDSIGGSDEENAFESLRKNIGSVDIEPVTHTHTLRAEVTNNEGATGNPTGLLVDGKLKN